MAGAWDWLDTATSSLGEVAGNAINAAGAVATAKVNAEAARAVRADTTPVPATSPLQTAMPGVNVTYVAVGVGVVALVGLVFLLRK